MAPHSNIHIPPIGRSLPVKSLSVRSRASNASLFVMGAPSTTVALPSSITLLSAVPFLILHMGTSIAYKSTGILKVLCNMQPPVNNVAAIPLDAVANAILLSEQSFARIRLIKKVLPVPPGASKNNMPPSLTLDRSCQLSRVALEVTLWTPVLRSLFCGTM